MHKISTLHGDPLQALEGLGDTLYDNQFINQEINNENISISSKNRNYELSEYARQQLNGSSKE